MEEAGKTCVYSVLSQKDYTTLPDLKLNEELAEYQESKSMEEVEKIRVQKKKNALKYTVEKSKGRSDKDE